MSKNYERNIERKAEKEDKYRRRQRRVLDRETNLMFVQDFRIA